MKHLLLPLLLIGLLFCCSNQRDPLNNPQKEAITPNEVTNKTYTDTLSLLEFGKAHRTDAALSEVQIAEGLTFIGCTFDAPVIGFTSERSFGNSVHVLGNITFINCTFNAPVNLRHLTVEGRTVFDGCTFNKEVRMENADFRGDASFRNNDFIGDLFLQNARFSRKAYFMDSECSEQASFQGAIFGGDAQFSVTKFFGYTDFSLTRFQQHAFFNYAEFPDFVMFNNTIAASRFELKQAILNEAEIRNAQLMGSTLFEDITLGKSLKLNGTLFSQNPPAFDKKYDGQIDWNGTRKLQWANIE